MSSVEELEEQLNGWLEQAMSMTVGLSMDDSAYDLNFISEKLALISVFQERLSDIMMKLTQFGLQISKRSRAEGAKRTLRLKELKASEQYADLPVNEKSYWLANQLQLQEEEAEKWSTIAHMVSEIRSAVGERAATMKRLDSDIRLHTKIYEAKVAAGATSPSSYTGNSTKDLDL